MKRVLVTGAANIGKAGVATIIYKWGQQFDSRVLVYDYLMQRGAPDVYYQNKIYEKGGRIFVKEDGNLSMFYVIGWIIQIIRDHKYKTIHINSDSAYIAAAYIWAAKKAGIEHIYVHSHCTRIDSNNIFIRIFKTIFHKLCMPYVCANSDMYLACSELAGIWMFGKSNVHSSRYKTIYNGVEPELYRFDPIIRQKYRKELGLEGKVTLCNIGRFSYQKNHRKLIDIFLAYVQKVPESILVLIGAGELEKSIRNYVKEKKLTSKVLFLGLRSDVPALLSAMDVMVMPSRFEGLPVTMVEAQMASLPCVVSSNITHEAKFTDIVKYVDGYNVHEWCCAIDSYRHERRNCDSEAGNNSKFNIKNAAIDLASILMN